MQVTLLNNKGEKSAKKATLDSAVFEAKINKQLITQAVIIYLGNQRQSNAHTKDRGEVSGGGKKPWRQKGTGRARHGSTRSPIWKGGGVTFGPTNEKNYTRTLSRKMKKAAIRSALSLKAAEDKVAVIEDFALKDDSLTASLVNILDNAKLEGKTLILQNAINDKLLMAASNLKNVKVSLVTETTTYEIMKYANLLTTEDSLESISKFWAGKAQEKIVKPQTKKKAAVKAETKTEAVKKSVKKTSSKTKTKK